MSQHSAAVALVNRLKFKHLALLVALDDTRNLHQAAEAVNVAQPSASRMLGDIEEAFGFLLFERNARGMTPTPLGVVTLAYARRSLAELTRFAEDLDVKRRGGHGQLTVGAIMGAAPDLLAMAVAALKTESPLLNVRILGETSDQVVQLLHRREVDLALGTADQSAATQRFQLRTARARNLAAGRALGASARAAHAHHVARTDRLAVGGAARHQSGARAVRRRARARRTCHAGEPDRMRVDLRHAAIARELRRGGDAARVGRARSFARQVAGRAAARNRQEPRRASAFSRARKKRSPNPRCVSSTCCAVSRASSRATIPPPPESDLLVVPAPVH